MTLLSAGMRIDLLSCTLRSWEQADARSLAHHADDYEIWRHLRDAFPHPYTIEDAHGYLARVTAREELPVSMAIEINGEACGSISAMFQEDVHRLTAEIGYWLGQASWGRGVMTEVVGAFTNYLFASFPLERVYAVPFANHPASARVLEKCGFFLEGTIRRGAIKEGVLLDQWLYARVR